MSRGEWSDIARDVIAEPFDKTRSVNVAAKIFFVILKP